MSTSGGTCAAAPQHRFDEARLLAWLSSNLAGFAGPLSVRQFEGGQSNPTFLLQSPTGRCVLRKKPPGPLAPSAHAIDREYRVLSALADTDAPAPRPLVYCEDDAVIGTPFYVMEYVQGRIFTDPLLPGLSKAERAAIYDAMNDTLARLHLVDWRAAGLADFGKPDSYFARQLARWKKQYELTRTGAPVEDMDGLLEWLLANIPDDEAAAVAHGDFRIGNLVFHATEPRVAAVLDWELATIGHPVADLAYNCMTYHLPKDDPVAHGFVGVDLEELGIPSETDYMTAYGRRTGRDAAPLWRFAMAFSLFRTAAIQQGVFARSLQGNASSSDAFRFGESFRRVASAGWRVARGG
jgi:aminoglycoside phosphotransferase (APT) family kinase protein